MYVHVSINSLPGLGESYTGSDSAGKLTDPLGMLSIVAMSLKPTIDYVLPAPTARVAKAAFPKGVLCLQLYDQLGTSFQDQDFVDLFPGRGQPALAPFRLALVTLLQYVEGLSDRAAANAVRSRLDWKYLLCLELEDPGFDFSVLCEFRDRRVGSGQERRLLDKRLDVRKAHRWVKARVRARTDSAQVLAAVREVNRLERVVETLRAALNVLATVIPAWAQQILPLDGVERYGARAEDSRLPQADPQRTAFAETVGQDGDTLLHLVWSDHAPRWLRQVPAVELLRQVWVQNFHPLEAGGARWRVPGDLPPVPATSIRLMRSRRAIPRSEIRLGSVIKCISLKAVGISYRI